MCGAEGAERCRCVRAGEGELGVPYATEATVSEYVRSTARPFWAIFRVREGPGCVGAPWK